MNEKQKEKILSLFKRNEFGVLATNSESGSPESAVMAFSETDDLCIVFGSFKDTRKNKNIAKDPHVSVVIGYENSTSVQFEGVATAVEGGEREILEEAHCQKNDGSQMFRNDLRQEYFKVVPTWIRYSNFSVDPQEVWEIDFK